MIAQKQADFKDFLWILTGVTVTGRGDGCPFQRGLAG
jgi:hypothetical protein